MSRTLYDKESSFKRDNAFKEVERLHGTGAALEAEGRILPALQMYQKAMQTAADAGLTNQEEHNRFHCGACLCRLDRLQESLAMLAPLLKENAPSEQRQSGFMHSSGIDRGASQDSFNLESEHSTHLVGGLIYYIRCAIDLPVRLAAIERALEQLDILTQHKTFLRPTAFAERANLLEERGRIEEALSLYQQAQSMKPKGYNYFQRLANLSIEVRKIRQAKRYAERWEREQGLKNETDNLWRQRFASWIARIQGNRAEGLRQARHATARAEQLDNQATRRSTFSDLVEALIANGECALARKQLGRVLALRRAESRQVRYALRRLCGDYHLACARMAAGLAPQDDVYDNEFPMPKRIENTTETITLLSRARRSYNAALRLGRHIDELLECSWRQEAIEKRLRRVAALIEKTLPTK